MIQKYNNISLVLGIPGIILQMIGAVGPAIARNPGGDIPQNVVMIVAPIAFAIMLTGTVLLITGLAYYAKAKGHHPIFGLLGFLSIIGLIALACLPDRTGDY